MNMKDLITNPENRLINGYKATASGPGTSEKIGLEFFVFYCI